MAEAALCPKCKHTSSTTSERGWYCWTCKQEFDPRDDGDYSDWNPAARLEREERRRERQLGRR